MILINKSKLHQHCKYCGKEIPLGLNKFCNDECKENWRKEYQAEWQLKKDKKTKYKYQINWRKKNPDKAKAIQQRWREKQKRKTLDKI